MRCYVLFICLLFLISCRSQTRFTEKFTKVFKQPQDSLSFQIIGPSVISGDSVLCTALYYKIDSYSNDTIIMSDVKVPQHKKVGQVNYLEFFSGSIINYHFKKYKATDYKIRIEYWFKYLKK